VHQDCTGLNGMGARRPKLLAPNASRQAAPRQDTLNRKMPRTGAAGGFEMRGIIQHGLGGTVVTTGRWRGTLRMTTYDGLLLLRNENSPRRSKGGGWSASMRWAGLRLCGNKGGGRWRLRSTALSSTAAVDRETETAVASLVGSLHSVSSSMSAELSTLARCSRARVSCLRA
jgi:hypothetical protein